MSETGALREDELQAFVDGRLDPKRQPAVLAYLHGRPEELARLSAYAEQAQALRQRLDELAEDEEDPVTAELRERLAARLGRPDYGAWARRAAVVALIFGAGWWSQAAYDLYRRLPPVVIEAAQAHEVFGGERQHPVELTAASQAEMAEWFSRHLGEQVRIPSLRAIGLRLVGGRLLPGEDGPVAQLLYEDRAGHRLTLALASERGELGTEFQLVDLEGLTAGYWQVGEITYALVAETSEQQLVAIATELGAPEPQGLL